MPNSLFLVAILSLAISLAPIKAHSQQQNNSLLIEEVLDKDDNNVIKDIKIGDRFYTPYQELEKSKKSRTIVNSKGFKK